ISHIFGLITTPAMMLEARVAATFFSPPFTPFRMAICTLPRGANFHSRALSNLLWIALQWD
ncbi:MAG: hypothetical protein U9N80_00790, partial [Chloroflexota bacterium]|nr:hypothetical protein [Chloroflexota bacterium]